MNTPGQAFFAAYGPVEPSTVKAFVEVAPRNQRTAATSARPQRSESVETMYADGACYRVDGPHIERTSRPHQRPAPVSRAPKTAAVQAVDTGWFNLTPDLQSSCVVLAPAVFPEATPSVPSTSASTGFAAPKPGEIEDQAFEDAAEPESIAESAPTKLRTDWAATWEVDEFAWPTETVELFNAHKEYFLYAGEKLRDASHEGLKVMAVAATREKEGCTTLAICLARGAAAAGARVALIDGNLFNPELGFKLGLDFSRGWQESYSDNAPLAEAAVVSLEDRITLFPLSADHRVPSLSDPLVSDVFRYLSDRFDLVIIDSGAIPSGDALVFEAGEACPVQAGMVVRDVRRSTEVETLVTASRLKSLGIEAIGIAENFGPQQQARAAA